MDEEVGESIFANGWMTEWVHFYAQFCVQFKMLSTHLGEPL